MLLPVVSLISILTKYVMINNEMILNSGGKLRLNKRRKALRMINKKVWLPDWQTDGRTDRQTPDKMIPMCRYASQATQNGCRWFMSSTSKRFCVVTDPHHLELSCRVNGVIKQSSNTNQLVHKSAAIVAFISRYSYIFSLLIVMHGALYKNVPAWNVLWGIS